MIYEEKLLYLFLIKKNLYGFIHFLLDIEIILLYYFSFIGDISLIKSSSYEELKFHYFILISSVVLILRVFSLVRTWEYKNALYKNAKMDKKIKIERYNSQILNNKLRQIEIDIAKIKKDGLLRNSSNQHR